MSRYLRALVLVCVTLMVAGPSLAQETKGIVEPGATLPIYVTSEALTEAENPTVPIDAPGATYWKPGPERLYGYALRDLRDYLEKLTMARFPLVALEPEAEPAIFAGTFAQFPDFKPLRPGGRAAIQSQDPEAFVIEVQDKRLFVLGKTHSGLIAAIYTLLDALGCKWYAPGSEWEEIPESGRLILDSNLDRASAGPSYHARFFFCSYGVNARQSQPGERDRLYLLWNLRNRMGGSAFTANSHNAPVIDPALFQPRPELFAKVKGQRLPYELARGNPEAIALATEVAVKYLKEHDDKGSYFDSFSAEPNDGVPADEDSLAMIGNHTATDVDFWFANQLAAGLENAGLTDKWIGILSYSDHAAIPSFDLHPKVSVQVTTDLDFSSNMTVEERLNGFRERKAQRLGIYEYLNLILWSRDLPGASPAAKPQVAANLKRWHEHGGTTYIAETSDSWVSGGVGQYLTARLLWDVGADPKKELDDYYRGAFGPAAAEIRQVFALAKDNYDTAAWDQFPPIPDEQIDQMFTDVRLPLDGQAKGAGVHDSTVNVLPSDAKPPAEIQFPELHNASAVPNFQHVLKVVAPVPKLTLEIIAGTPQGGAPSRIVIVRDDLDQELKRIQFKTDQPTTIELTDVRPGLYTVTFPDHGSVRLTVRGGNTFGAARAGNDAWGFNPFGPVAPGQGFTYRAYFVVPPGQDSLNVSLATGTVAIGFTEGPVIAAEFTANSELARKQTTPVKFAAADAPRIAYVEWKGHFLLSTGFAIEGVTLFSPDPSYALYESLD